MISLLTPNAEASRGERAAQTRALKADVRAHFSLGEDDSVFVAEIACGETDCPDVETVIAVFLAGQRREFKIHKPVASITGDDLELISIDPVRPRESGDPGAAEQTVRPCGPGFPLARE